MQLAAASVDPCRSSVTRPLIHIVAQPGSARNHLFARLNGAAQNPNLAQIARVSSAEISSSGNPASPSSEVPAPDLRPISPDNSPVGGAITGVCTLSP